MQIRKRKWPKIKACKQYNKILQYLNFMLYESEQ